MNSGRNKVLFLAPTLGGGGAERFFCTLLRYLDRSRFEPHLALFRAEGDYMQDFPADVPVHELLCSRGRYSVAPLVRLIRKLRPHCVLSTLPQCNLALTVSKPFLPRHTRLLLSEANMPSAFITSEVRSPRLWRWLYRHFYHRADKVICLSQSMIDEMIADFHVPPEKLALVYYPVDLSRVRRMGAAGENPYSGPGPQLVAVGRLSHQKGFDLLLSAMPAVREAFPHARLAILGKGALERELNEQARSLGISDAVSFFGFQQNPWRFVRHADLFVLSSRYEGLPHVLLEALALEKPIVAADCPGSIREVQALVPGMVVIPPENPQELARAIIASCHALQPHQNGTHAASANGSLNGLKAFSVPHIVDEYSKLILS